MIWGVAGAICVGVLASFANKNEVLNWGWTMGFATGAIVFYNIERVVS